MNPENALISRRIFGIDSDRGVVEELWDLSHPESPWVSTMMNPWNALEGKYIRQRVMTGEEFWRSNIPLKTPYFAATP